MKETNSTGAPCHEDRELTEKVIELLEHGREEILNTWVNRIRDEFDEPESTSDRQLADHMIYIVDAIIAEFRNFVCDPEYTKASSNEDISYKKGVIKDEKGGGEHHGKQRAKINAYNADKVYWEYALLRKVIVDFIQKNGTLNIDHLEIITSVIESCARESLLVFTGSIQKVQQKLLSSIVHDVRSPLNVISMTGELVKLRSQDSHLLLYADKILSSSGRISDMLEDMLLTLSAEAGQGLDLTFEEHNLNSFLSAISLEAQTLYGEKFRIKLPKYKVTATFDEEILKRVFENLVSNAFKYGDKQSDVTLSFMDTEDLILIEVHNFGDPIAKEHWQDIFKFLRRFEGQERQKRNSWGIGLAFVKAAVNGHGGKISVSSDNENGTRFVIELPKGKVKPGQSVTVSI